MSAILLIPIYEPTENTVFFINQLAQSVNVPIIIVDDGSGKTYQKLFQRMEHPNIIKISYFDNKGKGYALKFGFSVILDSYPDITGVVTADSDGQHEIEDIQKMLVAVDRLAGQEFLLGVRDFSYENTPFRSYFGNRMTSGFYYLSSGIHLQDTQTGLRGFSIFSLSELLKIEGNRFEYEINQLLVLPKIGYRMTTIPIKTIYSDGNKGSHFRIFQDSYLVYRPFIRFFFSSISSSLVDIGLFYSIIFFIGNHTMASLLIATVLSRVLSGIFNYQMNRHYVFRKQRARTAFYKYSLLFLLQLILSWLGVSILSVIIQSLLLCKAVVDILLFFVSFSIQRRIVFC